MCVRLLGRRLWQIFLFMANFHVQLTTQTICRYFLLACRRYGQFIRSDNYIEGSSAWLTNALVQRRNWTWKSSTVSGWAACQIFVCLRFVNDGHALILPLACFSVGFNLFRCVQPRSAIVIYNSKTSIKNNSNRFRIYESWPGVPYFRNETVLEWQRNRSTLDTAEDVQGSGLYQITSSWIAFLPWISCIVHQIRCWLGILKYGKFGYHPIRWHP